MVKIDDVLLVDNNQASNNGKIEALKAANIGSTYKVAMNGGHAHVCLEHMHLSERINNKKVLILLNLDTPIENGFVFLQNYSRNLSQFHKENIMIVVMTDEAFTEEKRRRAELMGVTHFMDTTLNMEELEAKIKTQFRVPAKRGRKPKVKVKPIISHLQVA